MRRVPGRTGSPAAAAALLAALLAATLALLAAAPAEAKFDPAHRWRTAETEHFVLHFHEGGEAAAGRAARIAEEVHARLAPRLGWEPAEKTSVVLADDVDAANGYATPYPFNQIVLFFAQPLEEPGFGAVVHDDWLRLVITHEYTHVLQFDMAYGLPRLLRRVFGRLYFPNTLQPGWLVEGLATYEETELTAGGRGRSPGFEMMLRMAALEGRVPTLDQMGVFTDSWPDGHVPYVFGESFVRFLVERHGREKLAEVSRRYAGRTLPFLVGSTGRTVLGEGYDALWREWSAALAARFREQERRLREQGLTASRRLTDSGFHTAAPAWSPDGRRIAYLSANEHEFPGVFMMDADGGNKRRIADNAFSFATSGSSLAWSPDGARVYYTKLDIRRGFSYFNDLYAYDLARGRELRVTRDLRARDPHVSPDGARLVFVADALGQSRLGVLELAGAPLPAGAAAVRYLAAPPQAQYANPRWSPDGTRIAVSVWLPGGDKDIWILDAAGGKVAQVARDRALDGGAAWSPDGRHLYFSSDRTGVFNVFAWELATGALRQVSSVLGGAFSPAPSPDGATLAFTSYHAGGHDVEVMPADPASWRDAAPFADPYPAPAPQAPAPAALTSEPYSPLSSLLPRVWVPWQSYSAESGNLVGIATFGEDALQRQRYTLFALYGPSSERVNYLLDYAYDGLRPTLRLAVSDLDVYFADFFQDQGRRGEYTERQRTVDAELEYPLLSLESRHAVALRYRRQRVESLSAVPPWQGYDGVRPEGGDRGSARLSWRFTNAHRFGRSISPERGRTVSVGAEGFGRALGSDAEFWRWTVDWTEYLPLPARHHVLQARVFAGGAEGGVPAQGAFQLGGDSPGDLALGTGELGVHLRGYPLNAFRGDNAVLATLEYRFPATNIERGTASSLFFLRRAHGAVFAEAGDAADGDLSLSRLKRSVGAEARLDLTLAWYLNLTLRAGVAVGLDDKGTVSPTLGVWLPLGLPGALSNGRGTPLRD